jgi:Spy/CpxP family protein refolding chaperone
MNTVRVSLLLPFALLAVSRAGAQQAPAPPPPDPLAQVLFAPDLVMQHQEDIGLKPEQRASITKAIQDFQTRVVELQWRLQDQSHRLLGMLQKPGVDRAAALAQMDSVLAVEREVKRAHLALLIEIKNTLSPEQQARLSAARAPAERR